MGIILTVKNGKVSYKEAVTAIEKQSGEINALRERESGLRNDNTTLRARVKGLEKERKELKELLKDVLRDCINEDALNRKLKARLEAAEKREKGLREALETVQKDYLSIKKPTGMQKLLIRTFIKAALAKDGAG